MKLALSACLIVLQIGCSATYPHHPSLIEIREVSAAGGTPMIEKVVDLGLVQVPREGKVKASLPDGRAIIGEYIAIWGSDFGKQPSVKIDQVPVDVLAHLDGGGLLVRVPSEIRSGMIPITLKNNRGVATIDYLVIRRGVFATTKGVNVIDISGETVSKAKDLRLIGVQDIIVSSAGDAAYAVIKRGKKLELVVVDLSTKDAKIVQRQSIKGEKLLGLTRSNGQSRIAIITDSHLLIADTLESLKPAFYRPIKLFRSFYDRPIADITLSPSGLHLAIAMGDKNEIAILNCTHPSKMKEPEFIPILEGFRMPLIKAIAFSRGGDELWVGSGDTKASIGAGHQNAQNLIFRLVDGQLLKPAKHYELVEKKAILAMTIGKGEPTPSGTTIRKEQKTSAAYFAMADPFILTDKTLNTCKSGELLRSSEQVAKKVFNKLVISQVVVVGQPQQLVGIGYRKKDKTWERVVFLRSAWSTEKGFDEKAIDKVNGPKIENDHFDIAR